MWSEVFTVVNISMLIFWVLTTCGLVGGCQHFWGTHRLQLQPQYNTSPHGLLTQKTTMNIIRQKRPEMWPDKWRVSYWQWRGTIGHCLSQQPCKTHTVMLPRAGPSQCGRRIISRSLYIDWQQAATCLAAPGGHNVMETTLNNLGYGS